MHDAKDNGLWSYRAFRQLVGAACVAVLLILAYRIRATLILIGAAFLLSYAVEPVVGFLKDRFRIPRAASAGVSLILLIGAMAVFWLWAAPQLTRQINELKDNLPRYVDTIGENLGLDSKDFENLVESLGDGETPEAERAMRLGDVFWPGLQRLFGIVGTVTATLMYAVFASLLVIAFFFLFVTYRGWGENVLKAVPREHRDSMRKLTGFADRALGAYVRGQVLVAVFTFTVFSIGFSLADVPYWFIVALIGGVFSLVPYGQVLGPASAIALKLLEAQSGDATFGWWSVVLAPLVVYAVSQSMETWVITPIIQGEVNKLHPALVLTVLILGGAIAGVVGLILAIPIAATIKASIREFGDASNE